MFQNKNQKKQIFRWFRKTSEHWMLSIALCLSGCMGVYEGGFECLPGEGVGCKSISDVNQMVDQCSIPSIRCSEGASTTEIWYAPVFNIDQKDNRKSRCLDESYSI